MAKANDLKFQYPFLRTFSIIETSVHKNGYYNFVLLYNVQMDLIFNWPPICAMNTRSDTYNFQKWWESSLKKALKCLFYRPEGPKGEPHESEFWVLLNNEMSVTNDGLPK